MSTHPPFKPPRRKPNVLWLLGGLFLLLLLLFLFQLFGPNPKIVVLPRTTHITTPLGADGLPDYEKFVLESYRQRVTPQNNAATLIWKALWPGDLKPAEYAAVAAELGLDEIPNSADSLVDVAGQTNQGRVQYWLTQQDAAAGLAPLSETADEAVAAAALRNRAEALIDRAMARAWTSEQIPPLADWVAANKKPIDLLVEASHRPKCYFPSPTLINDKQETLMEMTLPGQQSVRQAGRALSARAMWHLGEGRLDDAWQDLLAAHRIGRLTGQGLTMVEQLIGMAIANMARDGTLALLDHKSLSAEQARQIERDLASLEDFNSMLRSIDSMERLAYLDAVIHLAKGNNLSAIGMLPGNQGNQQFGILNSISIDWNVALQRGNELYDELSAAARMPNQAARQQSIRRFETHVMQLEGQRRQPGQLAAGVISRRERSEILASLMLGHFLPAFDAAAAAEERANSFLASERLVAALAVYRAEQGAYPKKLDDLTPTVLKTMPVDLYGRPFIYKPTKDGYLLYSAGGNGQDDGGSNERMKFFQGHDLDDSQNTNPQLQPQIPNGADDISIRLPRPQLTIPKQEPPPQ